MNAQLKIAVATAPRFSDEFSVGAKIGANNQPVDLSTDEQAFCTRIKEWMDSLAGIKAKNDGFDPTRMESRTVTIGELLATAKALIDGPLDVLPALRNLDKIAGRYEMRLAAITTKPFGVALIDSDYRDISNDRSGVAEDLLITVNDVPIPDAQQTLKVELDRTIAIIKIVLPTSGAGAGHGLYAWLRWMLLPEDTDPRSPAEIVRLRSRYIRTVWGIARVGLESREPSVAKLADKSLAAFREEFVAAEAGGVKNRYLRRLFSRCLRVAFWASIAYVGIRLLLPDAQHELWRGLDNLRNFFPLIVGTAIGTWLSFALRRVILTFLDLATLEEDRLDPTMRVLFVSALAGVVGLLLWTQAISVGLGQFQPHVYEHGIWALLLGLLLGIAERTVATAVYSRAADFGGAIGGK
jgi:hypothetical protein